jgi:trimethylamine--corrinoid protein Co-methyltransferase
MMDEAIGYSRRITRGIEVNEETLATDVIHSVGPNGHYLTHKHTQEHFQKEFWFPNLCDRRNYQQWKESGAKTMGDRVIDRTRQILATHQPSPIKPETEKAIKEVMEAAEDRVKNKS